MGLILDLYEHFGLGSQRKNQWDVIKISQLFRNYSAFSENFILDIMAGEKVNLFSMKEL